MLEHVAMSISFVTSHSPTVWRHRNERDPKSRRSSSEAHSNAQCDLSRLIDVTRHGWLSGMRELQPCKDIVFIRQIAPFKRRIPVALWTDPGDRTVVQVDGLGLHERAFISDVVVVVIVVVPRAHEAKLTRNRELR